MALPADVFSFTGPRHSFVLARGLVYRNLLRAGRHVELRPVDRLEATDTLTKIVHDSEWQLRSFYRGVGIEPPAGEARRSPRAVAEALLKLADRHHFGILRALAATDHGAERAGPPVGPVKSVLDTLAKERSGAIVFKGSRYRLVATSTLHRGAAQRDKGLEAVPAAEAEALLAAMADEARAAVVVKAALEEAARFLDRPGTGGKTATTTGLTLLREVQRGGEAGPAPPPPTPPPPAAPPRRSPRTEAPPSDDEPEIRLVNIEAPTFVPGVETTKITYAIDGPVAKTASVKMIVRSVPRKGAPSVVQSLAIAGPYQASAALDWDGKASTPGGLITLKGSPYEITFDLTSKSGHRSTSNTGSIRLEIKETKIVADASGPLDVPAAWKATVDAFIGELGTSGMPGDCEGRVIIESPLFKVNDGLAGDMYTNASFASYATKAGLGPTLPFLAQIKLKGKDGTGKRSAPVLIGTRLLWDFALESSGELEGSLGARGVQPTAKAFMKKVGALEEAATDPHGASAHFKVGGLRAKSADRAAAGAEWLSGGDWDLTTPAQRDWAAFTTCGDSASDAAADSAVYFSAGRMAGDTFKVRAVVDVDEALDVKDEAAPGGAPASQRSNVVKIVNWRRVPIVGNWIVGAGTTPVTIPPLTDEYRRAGMLIEPAPGVAPKDVGPTWVNAYQTVVDATVAGGVAFLDKALKRDPDGYPVAFHDFMDYWQAVHPDTGFFGTLWERIKTFFGGADKDSYQQKCEQTWLPVAQAVTTRIPIPDNGITAIKFGHRGPHNQIPSSGGVTVGMAPAFPGVTTRTKALFYQFTSGADTDTFIHEVGHTLFLAHAPGHFDPPKQPGGFVAAAHDAGQICLMSYHPDKQYLCGLCLLKLGGRDYQKIKNDGTVA